MEIQWYPGHMVKAKRLLRENARLVHVVVEIADARIPDSSRNPDVEEILGHKQRILVLNKEDLADPGATSKWVSFFAVQGLTAIPVNALNGRGIPEVIRKILVLGTTVLGVKKGMGRSRVPVRAMVVGIPNVGKSAFINAMVGKGTAATGDKPGVTRGKQWIRLRSDLELLDTPGVLWPKLNDATLGFKLAVTGAIGKGAYNPEELALELITYLGETVRGALESRYKVKIKTSPLDILQDIGKKRGCLESGGVINTEKAAEIVLREFRQGRLGRITLEVPPETH